MLPAIVLLTFSMGMSRWAGAAPITFNTALPVAEGEFVFREQLRWLRSSDDPSEASVTQLFSLQILAKSKIHEAGSRSGDC